MHASTEKDNIINLGQVKLFCSLHHHGQSFARIKVSLSGKVTGADWFLTMTHVKKLFEACVYAFLFHLAPSISVKCHLKRSQRQGRLDIEPDPDPEPVIDLSV